MKDNPVPFKVRIEWALAPVLLVAVGLAAALARVLSLIFWAPTLALGWFGRLVAGPYKGLWLKGGKNNAAIVRGCGAMARIEERMDRGEIAFEVGLARLARAERWMRRRHEQWNASPVSSMTRRLIWLAMESKCKERGIALPRLDPE